MDATSIKELEAELREALRGEVSFDPHLLGLYATDASHYQIRPLGLVIPLDREDVMAAVRVAAARGVALLPRGGGTSLVGQAIGEALILDFSKYMNRILEINVAERWVRVEPGIVRDELNAVLAPHRLHFAPDPATTSRANVGGMIANNASGTRSVLYGKTSDHVLELDVLLADGTRMVLAEQTPEAYAAKAAGADREAQIYRGVREIVEEHREEIRERFPKVMRRVGGYALDAFTDTDRWNLGRLVTGSEGTLAMILEARLRLEPLPAHTALCVAHFADLMEALSPIERILEHGPSAVEILDRVVLRNARENRLSAPICGFIEGDPAAVLIIEFYGATAGEVESRARAVGETLRAAGYGYAYPVMLDKKSQANVWAVRKNGLGMMQCVLGARKPTAFIEDAAVAVADLPRYIAGVLAICAKHGVEATMYAHASVGVIHVRPLIDLHREDDVERFKAISRETFELVVAFKGAWSGEHGDGLVRSPYNEEFFGPRLYAAFKEVKRLFDPDWRLNPGKVVEAPPIDQDLRYGPAYRLAPLQTHYHFRREEGFAAAVEMCTGVGACRKTGVGTMCPSYMATRDEEHSTRGRANALRLAMTGQAGPDGMTSDRLYETLELCLSCKACKSECPNNVDMARMKSEVLQGRHDRGPVPLRDRLIAGAPRMAAWLAGAPAPLVNALMGWLPVRVLLERVAGFSRERRLPAYARQPFADWLRARPARGAGGRQVVLFADTYLNFHEPEVGISAVELLESCGYEVIVAQAGCCQRPRLSRGFLREARRDGLKTLTNLDVYVRAGLPVVVCEPSCASALNDDLPDLIDDAALAGRMQGGIMMIDVFLAGELTAGRLVAPLVARVPKVLLHGHCHQKALDGTGAMKQVWSCTKGLAFSEVDSGCCGMAGSFGYEREHVALSAKIAGDRLLPALAAADADTVVVASGFSCRHQIAALAGRKALHWVETVRGPGA